MARETDSECLVRWAALLGGAPNIFAEQASFAR
jgi:hypothetical protein